MFYMLESSNIHITEFQRKGERECMEEILEEMMAKNYTKLTKDINSNSILYIENCTWAH